MPANDQHRRSIVRRYQLLAPIYELAIVEPVFFAAARARAIELLHLQPGQTVLDIACGTGLNTRRLHDRVGPHGRVIGIDYTKRMLTRASDRARRRGWNNVTFQPARRHPPIPRGPARRRRLAPGQHVDAAICTLGLSVIPDWEQAYQAILTTVTPGGRVAIMDAGYPAHPGTSANPSSCVPSGDSPAPSSGTPAAANHGGDSPPTSTTSPSKPGTPATSASPREPPDPDPEPIRRAPATRARTRTAFSWFSHAGAVQSAWWRL